MPKKTYNGTRKWSAPNIDRCSITVLSFNVDHSQRGSDRKQSIARAYLLMKIGIKLLMKIGILTNRICWPISWNDVNCPQNLNKTEMKQFRNSRYRLFARQASGWWRNDDVCCDWQE